MSRQGLNQNTRFAGPPLFPLPCFHHAYSQEVIYNTNPALLFQNKPGGEKCNEGQKGLFLVSGLPLVEDGNQASYMSLWGC